MRDSFVFYRSFYEAMQGLSDEQKGQCFEVLANYAINGIEPDNMNPVVRLFFLMAKPIMDNNNQKYENGKLGGRPKNQTETKIKPNNNQTITKPKPSENQTETNVDVDVDVRCLNNNNIPSNEGGKTEKINFALSQINAVFEKYNLPKILKLTDQRKIKLKQRIREVGGFNNFLGEMEKALAESSFLRGDNSRSWSADFDFFLQASSWQKVLEGKYADKQRNDDADYWADLEKRVEAANA